MENGHPEREVVGANRVAELNSRLDALPAEAIDFEKFGAEITISPEWQPVRGRPNPVLIEALRARGDAAAQTLLAAVAAICSEEALAKSQEREALAKGFEPPRLLVEGVGQFEITRAWQHPFGNREILYALLAKPEKVSKPNAFAWFAVGNEPAQGLLSGQIRSLLVIGPERNPMERKITPDAFSGTVCLHLQKTIESGHSVAIETAVALALIADEIGIDPDSIKRLIVEPQLPSAAVVDPLDSAEVYGLMDQLLPGFEAFVKCHFDDSYRMVRLTDFIGGAMLEFKGRFGSGSIYHWGKSDLAEFLLEWFPRKVALRTEDLSEVPALVKAFLHYLKEQQPVFANPDEDLGNYINSLVPAFLAPVTGTRRSDVVKRAIGLDRTG